MRIFSLLLLGFLLFGIGSYYPVFKVEQWSVQRSMKNKIQDGFNRHELTTIQLSATDASRLDWKEKNSEFEFDGNLFDIVKIDTLAGVIRFTCINDSEENELVARFDELLKNESDNGKQNTKSLVQLLNSLLYLPGGKIRFSADVALIKLYHEHCANYQFEPVSDISRPPSA